MTKVTREIYGDNLGCIDTSDHPYDQGIARTQSPTNKNDALELPTFGVIVEVSHHRCAMEEPHSRGTTFVIMVNPRAR